MALQRPLPQNPNKDWMFCPLSGQMLVLDPERAVAYCPQTGYTRTLEDLSKVSIESYTNMENYFRAHGLTPLVKKGATTEAAADKRIRATVDETCPKCSHRGLEFYTMQLRSADEGQTVFYECPKCGHKYSTNT